MKRLAFCFDGTWNRIVYGNPTNVSKLARSVCNEHSDVRQITYYDEGVGTHDFPRWMGWIVNRAAGALGLGLRQNIVEAYTFLVLNYEPGDEIYVFGFSRGAFTARSFIGLIRNVGIYPKRRLFNIREAVERYTSRTEDEHPNSQKSCMLRYKYCPHLLLPGDADWRSRMNTKYDGTTTELTIAYAGIWDTVGALGIPKRLGLSKLINRQYQFHDTKLSGFVKAARHAVAADEQRRTFEPALWTNLDDLNESGRPPRYLQRVYPGTHAAVGGGGPHRGLSDGPLEWIIEGAREAGLAFDTAAGSPIYALKPDHREPLFNEEGKVAWTLKDKFMGAGLRPRNFRELSLDQIDETINRRWHDPSMKNSSDGEYRPKSLEPWWDYIERNPPSTQVDLSDEIFAGIRHDDRALKTPIRVEDYEVQAQDDWKRLADKFYGDRRMWKALFLYNFDQKIVFKPDHLYASTTLKVPYY